MLAKAKPTESFWNEWRTKKSALLQAGISVSQKMEGRQTLLGDWEVCWWREIDAAEMARRKESVAMSRAADADIDVPAPEGLAYRPFQRAGIRFALFIMGLLNCDTQGLKGYAKRRLPTDSESTGGSTGESGEGQITGSATAGSANPQATRGKSNVEAAGIGQNSGKDARSGSEGAALGGSGEADGSAFQRGERETSDTASATSGCNVGPARIQTGSRDQDCGTQDRVGLSSQLQGRLRSSHSQDSGRTGRAIPQQQEEAVGGFAKDNDSGVARMASIQDQARKGGMPNPSRGDSCGVLIADEMG